MLTSRTRRKRERMFFILCFLLANVIRVNASNDDNARVIKHHVYPGMETYENNPSRPTERSIFTYQRAGVRVDVKIVSIPRKNSTSEERKIVESFPEFPAKDIGRCVLDLSLICIKKRFAKLMESIGRMDEITLIGQDVKLVKTRTPRHERRSINSNDVDSNDIERSIDDFFDTFVLRITLPRWNGKREKNQIDVMFDESGPKEVFEGRGIKGGGGGGGGLGGNKGGGGGGGGKCKMMMMAMLMLAKMKIIGVIGMMAMKGMIMGAMSLMISTVMLMMKFLKGGGPWQGGGGGGGGTPIKEVVLLAKIPNGGGGGGGYGGGGGGYGGGGGSYGGGGGSYGGGGGGGYGGGGGGGYGGGGNGGCCNGNGGDSYSPPSTSYGVPSGGGGYGGGWGRSFSSRLILPSLEANRNNKSITRSKIPLMIGESIDNRESPNYEEYQDLNVNLTLPRIDSKPFNYTTLPNYGNINGSINANNTKLVNSTTVDANGKVERAESFYDLKVLRPVYTDEWQAVENVNALNEKANKDE